MSHFLKTSRWQVREDANHSMARRYAEIIAAEHDLTPSDLLGRSHKANIVAARDVLIAAMREEGLSYSEIGRAVGRDHTTVLHSLRKAEMKTRRKELFAMRWANEECA